MTLTDREVAVIVARLGRIVFVLDEEDLRLLLEEVIAKRPRLRLWQTPPKVQHQEC